MKSSIEDVARLAGVSTATVSRTFSRPEKVSPKTREKVQLAADQLDFYVSRTAAILKSGHVYRVALLFGGSEIDWFTAKVMEGLNSILRDKDYDLAIYPIGDEEAREAFFTDLPVRGNADAVIVSSFMVSERQRKRLEESHIPLVGINAKSPAFSASVCIDDEQAITTATNYLLGLGHRSILYVYEEFSNSLEYSSRARINTFKKLCRQNLNLDGNVIAIDKGISPRDAVVETVFNSAKRPSAVLFHQDSLAIPFFFTMQQNGLRIPEDVSVMGFDDSVFAQDVGLTTMRQDPVKLAALAAKATIQLIEGKTLDQRHIEIPTQLVVRNSVIRI